MYSPFWKWLSYWNRMIILMKLVVSKCYSKSRMKAVPSYHFMLHANKNWNTYRCLSWFRSGCPISVGRLMGRSPAGKRELFPRGLEPKGLGWSGTHPPPVSGTADWPSPEKEIAFRYYTSKNILFFYNSSIF